jgi:hypothetical protein
MVTLTYRALQADLVACKRHLSLFCKRMMRAIPGWRYVAAFERQKRGAWHVHIACHALPAVLQRNGVKVKSWNVIRAMWREVTGDDGNIDVSRRSRLARKSPAKLAAYLSKYMLKDWEQVEPGTRRFQASATELEPVSRIEIGASNMRDLIDLAFTFGADFDCEVVTAWLSRHGDTFFLATEPRRVDRSIHCRFSRSENPPRDMDLDLYSIDQAPRTLPLWESILDDLGRPSAARIGRTLDVGASTVYRWNQTGQAPRMACLALFWLTRWGRSEVDCRATNDATMAVALARSLSDERRQLHADLAQLAAERDRLRSMLSRALLGRGSDDWHEAVSAVLHTLLAPTGMSANAHRPRPADTFASATAASDDRADAEAACALLELRQAQHHPCPTDRPRPPGDGLSAPKGAPSAAPGVPGATHGDQGAQAPTHAPTTSAREAARRRAEAARLDVARAAAAGSQHRGLDGRSHGAAPHTPAPRAPLPPCGPGQGATAALASQLYADPTTHPRRRSRP